MINKTIKPTYILVYILMTEATQKLFNSEVKPRKNILFIASTIDQVKSENHEKMYNTWRHSQLAEHGNCHEGREC